MHHEIELTKKGQAYALVAAGVGADELRKAIGRRINLHLAMATALIETLDVLDGDPEAEDDSCGEPSLGGPAAYLPDGSIVEDCEFDIADLEWSVGVDQSDADGCLLGGSDQA